MGTSLLIISRLFGFAVFELISYAAGLTTLSFRRYFVITAVISLVPNLVYYLAFRQIDASGLTGTVAFVISLLLTGALFAVLLTKYIRGRRTR
jgi:uncharacterized membrane protein YdjX (TVP38/TMEM64 family)